jgi:hypothetical protein
MWKWLAKRRSAEDENRPHPQNVPGPFYVVDGCCLSCDVPRTEAPEHFVYDNSNHCFVKRQPTNRDEVTKVLRAAWFSEVGCIRYRGNDPDIIRRLAESGESQLCDTASVVGIEPVERNHVSFAARDLEMATMSAFDIAREFQRYVESRNSQHITYRFTPIKNLGTRASLTYAWYQDQFHSVEFERIEGGVGHWLIRHGAPKAASWTFHDWLTGDTRLQDVRWYSKDQWNGDKQFQDTPW